MGCGEFSKLAARLLFRLGFRACAFGWLVVVALVDLGALGAAVADTRMVSLV